MLDPEFIKKIRKMHIKTGRMVNTMMAGQYRSVFRGAGIEFEEVREYSPGDEVKSIDWKVSARMGRPYIKLYQEERELVVMLMVDMSASVKFGTSDAVMREIAAEIAGVLAFNAVKNNDKVGAVLFTDQVEKYIPPQKGSAHVWRVIREIFSFRPEGRGTDIRSAVNYLSRVCRKKTVSFLVSDFHSANYIKELKIASRKHDLIGIVLSDPGEFQLPEAGIVTVKDFETGYVTVLDASDSGTRKSFEKLKLRQYRDTLSQMKRADIDYIEINTRESVTEPLVRYFRLRERRQG